LAFVYVIITEQDFPFINREFLCSIFELVNKNWKKNVPFVVNVKYFATSYFVYGREVIVITNYRIFDIAWSICTYLPHTKNLFYQIIQNTSLSLVYVFIFLIIIIMWCMRLSVCLIEHACECKTKKPSLCIKYLTFTYII
jgi:hypothetical protein